MSNTLKIGTRKSDLALAQTALVEQEIAKKFPDQTVEIVHAITSGDAKQGTPAAAFSDKRDWISGLEEMLVNRHIDIAIHSAKDVPAEILEGTAVLPILNRALAGDVFIGKVFKKLADLPSGARIGTASPRRTAQLKYHRSDIEVIPLRGNITTRISKLFQSEDYDGIILAAAGIERLGCFDGEYEIVSSDVMLPCVGQGQLAAQFRVGDETVKSFITAMSSEVDKICFASERQIIASLGADCSSAIGTFAHVDNQTFSVKCQVFGLESSNYVCLESFRSGKIEDSQLLSNEVSSELISKGAKTLL